MTDISVLLYPPEERITVLRCPHCTLALEHCHGLHPGPCHGCVHVHNKEHWCNPRNPDSPYIAENPEVVIK